jgi:RNA polymerase sigma factor (sigma-70 family)
MSGPSSEPPEVELQRLRCREPAAFSALVAAWQPRILGLCQSLGMRGADIDVAAAEVFWQVYQSLPRFDGRAELATWIHRIAWRTICRQRLNRRRHAVAELATEPAAAGAEAHGLLETREQRERLWAAVAALEPRQAAVVDLYYRQQVPIAQIAAALECPEGTIKTLLFRAREKLRPVLLRRGITP